MNTNKGFVRLFPLLFTVSCALLVFALLYWFRAISQDNQKFLRENPSVYASQTLGEAEIEEGDLLEVRDGNRTWLYYVHHVMREGGDPHDRIILESPGRFYSASDGMYNWWRIREWVVSVYHKGQPGYNEKAADYINQPH